MLFYFSWWLKVSNISIKLNCCSCCSISLHLHATDMIASVPGESVNNCQPVKLTSAQIGAWWTAQRLQIWALIHLWPGNCKWQLFGKWSGQAVGGRESLSSAEIRRCSGSDQPVVADLIKTIGRSSGCSRGTVSLRQRH